MDYAATFGTPNGRRVLWDLLSKCHVFQPSFKPGQSPEMTAFREGERNIGLQVMATMEIRTTEELKGYAETEEEQWPST
jgi:hypothetical protein